MFQVDPGLVDECRDALSSGPRLTWIVGGSGSGKSTLTRAAGERLGIPVIDMDERIYGSFHRRYSPTRHPVSSAWSSAGDPMRWLLEMSWDEFDAFGRAALPENLDLLASELGGRRPGPVLVDGGVSAPGLLASVVGPSRILCLVRRDLDARALWSEPGPRLQMRDGVLALDGTGELWERFLEFDRRITARVGRECRAAGVAILEWDAGESQASVLDRMCQALALGA